MKKIFLLVLIFCLSKISVAQYSPTQNIGCATCLVQVPANGGFRANLINRVYADTTAANSTNVKYYDAAQIRTTSDSSFWFRHISVSNPVGMWIKYAGASGGAGGDSWLVTGNVGLAEGRNILGTTDATPIAFTTNSTERLRIRADGIPSMTASNDSVLVKNTSNEIGVIAKSALVTTPTWQQTLTAGNTASSNLVLDNTTSSSTAVIYKSSNPFLHNFKPSGSVGRNTFLGELAGNFTMTSSGSTSSNITAIGYNAAHGNTTGFDYVSIGVNNLVSITEGSDHTSVGNYALDACTTCTGFSVLGYSAFGSNVSGADGSAVGYDAFRNSTGSRNSGIGVDVFNDLVSGNNNFGGGFNAGDGITGGSGNTILGTATFTSGTYDSLVVLANGFNQKRLYINGNGAWSLDGGSTYGTSGYFLTTTGSGGLPVYSNTLPSGTTIPISSLRAATETNAINNANYLQSWNWNSLSGKGLELSANSTAAASNLQWLLVAALSGANSNSSQETRTAYFQNSHTGTSSTNIAGYFEASGGTNNYAIIVPASSGSIGIGTSTPDSLLTVELGIRGKRGVRFDGLPTGKKAKQLFWDTDGTIYVGDSTGTGGGGSSTPAGNFGNLQLNRNGAFATPGSDSLDFESATGLSVKGAIRAHTGIIQGSSDPTTLTLTGQSGTYSMNMTYSNSAGFRMSHQGVYQFWQDGGIALLDLTGSAAIFNYSGRNYDFQVEGDNDANMIYGDASADKVGIGTASPTTKLQVAGTFAAEQGADVASANNLAVISNSVEITGTTQINLISNTGWVNGSVIHLIFTSTPTVKNGQTTSGSNITILLAGAADFSATADDVLTLMLCEVGGTQAWREVSRSVN